MNDDDGDAEKGDEDDEDDCCSNANKSVDGTRLDERRTPSNH